MNIFSKFRKNDEEKKKLEYLKTLIAKQNGDLPPDDEDDDDYEIPEDKRITKELAKKIDWGKATKNFNLVVIRNIVRNIGSNNREKKIIIHAIHDAEFSLENLGRIPFRVDMLLNYLHIEYDRRRRMLGGKFDSSRAIININSLTDKELVEYLEKYTLDRDEVEELIKNDQEDTKNFNDFFGILWGDIKKLSEQVNQLQEEKATLEKQLEETIVEQAFNARTELPCFTNKQMGIFLRAIGEMIETPNPPAKTQLGEVVEKIAGYKATTVNQNMKGPHRKADLEVVAMAIESKFPKLAAKVRKL